MNQTKEWWRDSAKANEFREYFDKTLKSKKPTMGGLDREIIVDFIAKEIKEAEQRVAKECIKGFIQKLKDANLTNTAYLTEHAFEVIKYQYE